MKRDNAIKYLDRKEKIDVSKGKFSEKDEAEIEKVMKEGKIYGDPIVNLKY
jgi:hypothetical protein